jgi:hypothetical protein
MRTLALVVMGGLAFIVLAGAFELRESRRTRRRLLERKDRVLHPFAQHGLRRLRSSTSRRVLHYVGLFFGFLLVFYVLMFLGQGIVALLSSWR